MRALVIFDSRYGNAEKIASSLRAGISEAGVQTGCINARDVNVESLKDLDLVCIGAPTEAFSAYKPIKDFIAKLDGAGLAGKWGFAFDTKLDWRISGSSAKFIEKELKRLGLRVLAARESAIVFSPAMYRASTTRLEEVEERRFQRVGKTVGDLLQASAKPVIA